MRLPGILSLIAELPIPSTSAELCSKEATPVFLLNLKQYPAAATAVTVAVAVAAAVVVMVVAVAMAMF
jgi:negative regulator of sigma E activity